MKEGKSLRQTPKPRKKNSRKNFFFNIQPDFFIQETGSAGEFALISFCFGWIPAGMNNIEYWVQVKSQIFTL